MLEGRAPINITEIKRFNIGIRVCMNMGGYKRVKVIEIEARRSGK